MVKGKLISERVPIEKPNVDYRKIDALNQSMLKKFDEDPIKFFNEFKLGKKKKSKSGVHLIIGDIVDFYILECGGDENEFQHRFDEKFVLYKNTKGSGQVYKLADYLFEETENCINDKGEITCSFVERFKVAYNRAKGDNLYKGDKNTLEKVLEDFNKNGKEYFDLLMSNIGKTVVDVSILDKAKSVANIILSDSFTVSLFNDIKKEKLTHFPIEWKYSVKDEDIDCKSEIDMILIDHEMKEIYPYDLKTNYDNESFDYMYLKNSYYIQAGFYTLAITQWAKENGMEDYVVKEFSFIVGDTSSNNRRPLIYKLSIKDIENALNGFYIRGQRYRGVVELIDDIIWAEKHNEWRCSKDAWDNDGIMKLNINYEK